MPMCLKRRFQTPCLILLFKLQHQGLHRHSQCITTEDRFLLSSSSPKILRFTEIQIGPARLFVQRQLNHLLRTNSDHTF